MAKIAYKLPPSVQTLRSFQMERTNHFLSIAVDFVVDLIMKDALEKIVDADFRAMKYNNSSKINRIPLSKSKWNHDKTYFLYLRVDRHSNNCTFITIDPDTYDYESSLEYKYYPLNYVINGDTNVNAGQTSVIYRLNAELSKLGYRVMTGEGSDCERCGVYIEWDNPSYVTK